ncbi:DNA-binding response OmpR family regulator [Natranaerovirga pectinivora]|uniref:Stage 0 sporulation protein A homolog n=1 Tax=Natranaerovirga pectinivora TaxID=682400 RepID=A0A4R3MT53_9FIRM|nr:response regulator transcription factor [Natranaerovirga pectinivora]TCT16224.1 DNA-binding response OmpR family regulator [Natranaerovirga pectinivora]
MSKILIVEDDMQLSNALKTGLEGYGYQVIVPETLINIEEVFEEVAPDLTLLDVNLPYKDGFTLCRLFRLKSEAPIIFISSRGSEFEQIYGMDIGADEYIVKPFSLQLLEAKIKTVLRRYQIQNIKNIEVQYNGLVIDTDHFKLYYRDKETTLSRNELILSKLFIANPNKIFERYELLKALWDTDIFVHENTLNVNIKRLKDKLATLEYPYSIRSKRSVGYYMSLGDGMDEN